LREMLLRKKKSSLHLSTLNEQIHKLGCQSGHQNAPKLKSICWVIWEHWGSLHASQISAWYEIGQLMHCLGLNLWEERGERCDFVSPLFQGLNLQDLYCDGWWLSDGADLNTIEAFYYLVRTLWDQRFGSKSLISHKMVLSEVLVH
jgi:hypothetical protein